MKQEKSDGKTSVAEATSKNGNESQTANGGGAKQLNAGASPKTEEPAVKPVLENERTNATLTVSEILERTSMIAKLEGRRKKYIETFEKLRDFKLSAEEETVTLTMKDKDGTTFVTANPAIMKGIQTLILDETTLAIYRVEGEIKGLY